MTDVSAVAANLDDVRTEIGEVGATLSLRLEELTAASECLTPGQVYTAVALHALMSRLEFAELQRFAGDAQDLRTVASMALAFGDAVYRRELEALKANQA